MLTSVDRVLLVVRDREAAVQTWRDTFAAEKVRESGSRLLNAHITAVQAGASEFEFLQPAGAGPVADFASSWGEGLFGAGFTTRSLLDMRRHLGSEMVEFKEEDGRLIILGDQTSGMPTVITEERRREPVGGVITHLYEVTNPVADWQDTAALYTRIFGLDPVKYWPIASELYGYEGTLTLFDPPNRLDRIEITQTRDAKAMDRFFQRRGPGLYMCYAETDDVEALAARLRNRGARFAQSEDRPADTGLFIHPSALHGMLMGISRTNYAWVWSGHPELAGQGAAESYRAH
jgi:catechol 2,3-dioxygenase-like lactoylglutathione lyase family enzyme